MAKLIDCHASGEGQRTTIADVTKEQMDAAMTRELTFLKREREERARRLGLNLQVLITGTNPAQFAPHKDRTHENYRHTDDFDLTRNSGGETDVSGVDKNQSNAGA